MPAAVDIGSADVLIVHRDDVPMVAADVSFLVLETATHVILLSVTGAVDAWKLLHLAGIVDVLRRPVVLEDGVHVLIVAMRARVVTVTRHLALKSVRAFYADTLIVG